MWRTYQIWILWDNFCQLCTTQISGFHSFCGQGYALTRHAYIQSVAFWCRIKVKIQYQHPFNKAMTNNFIRFETGWQQKIFKNISSLESVTFANHMGRFDKRPQFHKPQWICDNGGVHIGLLNKYYMLAFFSFCKPYCIYQYLLMWLTGIYPAGSIANIRGFSSFDWDPFVRSLQPYCWSLEGTAKNKHFL